MTKTCLIGCALLISGQTASADVVVDWNIQAGQTIGAGARRGPSGSFDFAMVHAAMHDAVQAFEHRFEPYCADIPKASGSPIAAAAAAAHAVLSALFPAQAEGLDAAYDGRVFLRGLGGWTLAEYGPVAPFWQFDDQGIMPALGGIVLIEACPETDGLGPHDPVQFRVVAGSAAEDFDGDDRFLELVLPAVQVALNQESQELGLAVVPRESGAR